MLANQSSKAHLLNHHFLGMEEAQPLFGMDIGASVSADQLRSVAAVFAVAFLCSLLFGKLTVRRRTAVGKTCPQPSRALPIIGHLHLLNDDSKPLAYALGELTDKCGLPVYMLRLGMHPTLVVNGWEAAKECLTTNDKVLATRPTNAAGKYLGFDYSMVGFAPYGSYWRSIRKIAMLELLSNARIEMFKDTRSMEVDLCIKDLYGLWVVNGRRSPVSVDMKQWLGDLTFNVVINILAGKRYFGSAGGSEEAWRFRSAVGELFRLLNVFVPADMFPFLKWFHLSVNERAMKAAAQEMDIVMSNLLEEHRRKRSSGKLHADRDFMDVMLSVVPEDAELCQQFEADRIIKVNSLAFILGGADTTSVSMVWTVAALVNNKQILKRVQEELDVQVGRERLVKESDINKLAYLQAVVKEAFRLYPPAQLLVPHEAMEDCCISGYTVPRGTRVLVNVWKLQRDPQVWEDPLEFWPERFLTSHAGVDVRGQQWELIPFGAGRRACPGISFAMQVIHLTIARLVQGFNLDTPDNGPVDMSPGLGITAAKYSCPLQIVLSPRLMDSLYEA